MNRGTTHSEQTPAPTPSAPSHSTHPRPTQALSSSLEDRVDRLERMLDAALARMEAATGEASAPSGTPSAETAPAPGPSVAPSSGEAPDPAASDRFWALSALKSHLPAPGGVVYAGAVDLPSGRVEYQWGRPTDSLLRADWADRAERVAALGHPLRLSLLQRLLAGECTVAQLVDELDLASTGVAYHHLHQLQGAGWVTSPARGTWAIPATRVVPLLAIITALEEA